ncbi:MAG TPA: PPC domain-containing protein [Longimicrobium sp.]|nr:PPC domain-containing protein [Longimicrobium sp.]
MRVRDLMVLVPLALAGCATGGGGGGGAARAETTVSRLLAQAGSLARQHGYTQAASRPATGALNHGLSEAVDVTLNGGREYLLVGVCDQDCGDMDLRLSTPSGAVLAQDMANDDTPVLQFTAPSTGSFRVRVMMANCTANPCYYGVALYRR